MSTRSLTNAMGLSEVIIIIFLALQNVNNYLIFIVIGYLSGSAATFCSHTSF